MPTEHHHAGPTEHQRRDSLRLALGVFVSFMAAIWIAWPLAYLSTVVTCILLSARASVNLAQSFGVSVIVALMSFSIYLSFAWFSQYPLVILVALFIACYATLYWAARGAPEILSLTALMALLIIPSAHYLHPELSWLITQWLPINGFIGFAISSVMLLLMPLNPVPNIQDDSYKDQTLSEDAAHARALELACVILPVVAFYWWLNSSDILLMVVLSLFIHKLIESSSVRYQVTLGYTTANIVGGALAVVSFELLVAAPTPLFLLLLCAAVLLLLTQKAFVDAKWNALSSSATNAFVALLGGTILYNFSESEVAYWPRLIQIVGISVYLLLALEGLEYIKHKRKIAQLNHANSQ